MRKILASSILGAIAGLAWWKRDTLTGDSSDDTGDSRESTEPPATTEPRMVNPPPARPAPAPAPTPEP